MKKNCNDCETWLYWKIRNARKVTRKLFRSSAFLFVANCDEDCRLFSPIYSLSKGAIKGAHRKRATRKTAPFHPYFEDSNLTRDKRAILSQLIGSQTEPATKRFDRTSGKGGFPSSWRAGYEMKRRCSFVDFRASSFQQAKQTFCVLHRRF